MRLPVILPDFTRVIWHSAAAKAVWAERISKVSNAWLQIERQAVLDGIRDGCLTFLEPSKLPEASLYAAARGFTIVPLGQYGVGGQYSATPQSLVAGKPWQYRIVLTRPEKAAAWAEAWTGRGQGTNDQAVGELLGYPVCCRDFFQKVWVTDKGVDTTWEMALGTEHPDVYQRVWERGEEMRIPAGMPSESNILLRWFGLRLVPHLPCSFQCAATVKNAREYAEVGRRMGLTQEVDWLYEMLEWPVEWSALHGIAEVRTPVATVSTRTTATATKLVVQRAGTLYPDEGASGLRFPFRIVTGKVTEKPAYQRMMVPVWQLNGFGSEEYMNLAHETLLSVLPAESGTFLDLGCGTGRLLERAEAAGWTVQGVEMKDDAAGAAKVSVRRGDLLDPSVWTGHFDVVAFMPGRLLETTPDKAEECRQALRSRARAVLLYAYGDWLSKHGGLGPLAAAAGLGDGDVVRSASAEGVEAALVVFTHAEDLNGQATATIGHGSE